LIASSESVKIFTDRLAGILHVQHCLQRPSCHFGTVPGVRNEAKHIDVYLSGIGWKFTPILHQLNLNQISKANTFDYLKIVNPSMNESFVFFNLKIVQFSNKFEQKQPVLEHLDDYWTNFPFKCKFFGQTFAG
jgi:hypothetical protein